MKTNAILLLSMIMSSLTYGQMNPQFQLEEMQITPPEFPSLETADLDLKVRSIHDYLRINVRNPQDYNEGSLPGTEVVAFVVMPSGELTDFRVINSVSSAIDEEMIRVLKETSGSWIPGLINGDPVAMGREVSVVFRPHPNYDIVRKAKAFTKKGSKMHLVKKNPERALNYFNVAVRLLPNEVNILAARSLCKYELGDELGAREDYQRINTLRNTVESQLQAVFPEEELNHLAGYAEYDSFPQNLADQKK